MQLIRIGYNHDTGRNLEIWLYFLKKFQLGFSSKIEVPRLGSTFNLHSSALFEPENSSSNSFLETIFSNLFLQKKKEILYNPILYIRRFQISMQSPHLCAKPCHFCHLDLATFKKAFDILKHMLYNMPLWILEIEGTL